MERAEATVAATRRRGPRQTDLRRAVSDAYYAMFHTLLSAAADTVAGKRPRDASTYGLAYRSVDHRTLRDLCQTVRQRTPPRKYEPHIPGSGFGTAIREMAGYLLELQIVRNLADYDPMLDLDRPETEAIVSSARAAITHWHAAPLGERQTFLRLLLFPPR